MKKILSIVIVAAALLSIASCQKENLGTPTVEPEKTVRVITGEFYSDGTKSTLGTNDKPLWSVGDVIRVLNSTACEDITLTSSNIDSEDASKITFSTTLSGMLYAVYPASATTMTSCSDGNITFTIPAVQDGTFGSANICVASGDGPTGKSIYFSNATAVVEMTVKSGVVYANLGAANNIAGNMTVAMGNKGAISTTTPSLSSKSIFVTGTPSESKFYMAVAPGETGAVTITCNTSTKSGSTGKSSKTLAMNKIYAVNLSNMTIETNDLTGQHGVLNGQEYVMIKGSNGKYLKWATQNLAVTESGRAKWNGTNYIIGDYFQWAASYAGYNITEDDSKIPTNLVIYTSFTNNGSSGSFSDWKDSKQFNKASAPYRGTAYTKYTGTSGDGKNVLEQSDDVANIVLGSTWRMPTSGSAGEIKAMKKATTWTWNGTDKGYYVTKSGESLASDKSNALLFFPAAGYGFGTTLNYAGSYGYYWGTFGSGSTGNAYCLFFSSSVNPGKYATRFCGLSVRPVSD